MVDKGSGRAGQWLERLRPYRGSIRSSLLATFIILSVIIVLLIAGISIISGTRTSRALVFNELTVEAELTGSAITTWLDERILDLQTIASDPHTVADIQAVIAQKQTGETEYRHLEEALQKETAVNNRIDEIFLLNPAGQVILSTDSGQLGHFYGNDAYFQEGLNAPIISRPFYDRTHAKNEMLAFVPVKDAQGETTAVLGARLDMGELAKVILAFDQTTDTGETYLVSRNHRFLTDPRFAPLSRAARSVGIDAALTPGPQRNGQGIYENYNGVPVVGVYRWLPELEAALLSEQSVAEAMAGVRQQTWLIGGAAVLVLLLAVAFALYVTGRITRPIVNLTETATAIAAGDLHRPVAVQSEDEIGRLARAFTAMTGQLNDLIAALEGQVTDLRAAENRLREYAWQLEQINRELERSNAELQDFAYVASHDLQEPLRKIQTFGSRLETRYGAALDDRGQDYLARMISAAARMQALIEDLLAFSRVTTRAQPFEMVDLNRTAADALRNLETAVTQTNAQIELDDLPAIEADSTQMQQLFQNLLGNAIKFHKEDAPPQVRVYSQLRPSAGQTCGEWQIFVEDNGIGLDEKYVDRIFDVFQRLHPRTRYPGSGVGLAICRKIVERHHGRLAVRSQPGEGATFIVTLPASQPKNESADDADSADLYRITR